MESISKQLEKIKKTISAQTDFREEIIEVIHRVSGIKLTPSEINWRPPTLIVKTNPSAKNTILRAQEKIISILREKFDRHAPQSIR